MTPPMQTTVNMPDSPDLPGSGGPQKINIPGQPIMRPSFLQAFLANLGPALAGGLQPVEGHPFGTGLGGAMGGIQAQNQRNREFALQAQAQQREQAQSAAQIAGLQAQTQRSQQLLPGELQQQQLGTQEQQLNLQMRQGILSLANNPDAIKQVTDPMIASLGKISSDEQAQLDAANGVFQTNLKKGNFDPSPIQAAVTKISQDRIARKSIPKSAVDLWHEQFVATNGREPTPKEIEGFQASGRMMFAPENRIIEVADPDHPGETKFVRAGTAVAQGIAGKTSASVQVPKNVLKWATTGAGGVQAAAFNTAMQHADLLTQAVKALGNGDQNTLNSLRNKFKNEFGSTEPLTAQVIASAYTREINKMLSSGHMTDSDIKEIGTTLNVNRQSQEQALGALAAYRNLAASKMNVLYDQFQKGMQGKPNFPASTTGTNTPSTGNEIHYKIVNGQLVPQ